MTSDQNLRCRSIAGINHRTAKGRMLSLLADKYLVETARFEKGTGLTSLEYVNFWNNFLLANNISSTRRSHELLCVVADKMAENTLYLETVKDVS